MNLKFWTWFTTEPRDNNDIDAIWNMYFDTPTSLAEELTKKELDTLFLTFGNEDDVGPAEQLVARELYTEAA